MSYSVRECEEHIKQLKKEKKKIKKEFGKISHQYVDAWNALYWARDHMDFIILHELDPEYSGT